MINIIQIVNMGLICVQWMLIVEGKRKSNYDIVVPPPPITYDSLGNCYVDSLRLKGHCVRYHQCWSAVQNWQHHRQIPYSCYYNEYDNFVCCPEAYVAITTSKTAATMWQSYNSNPFLTRYASHFYQQEQRISELECSSIYNETPSPHRHHRSKRSLNDTMTPATDDDSSEFVQEEVIEKTQVGETHAVGGLPTIRNEFPYMCALGWRKSSSKPSEVSYNCGCVLIAQKYVLTAAHCTTLGGDSPSVVRLGGADLGERHAEVIKIRHITEHPEYDPKFAYNDIALVKLQKATRVTPACLWSKEGLPQEVLTALGYGHTKFAGQPSNSLLKVYLNVLTNEDCNYRYQPGGKLPHGVDAGQICAGDPRGKMDTCQGDSGGPLLLKVTQFNSSVPYIVGLTSFGEGCATGSPGVYTRISYFLDWIEAEVWK